MQSVWSPSSSRRLASKRGHMAMASWNWQPSLVAAALSGFAILSHPALWAMGTFFKDLFQNKNSTNSRPLCWSLSSYNVQPEYGLDPLGYCGPNTISKLSFASMVRFLATRWYYCLVNAFYIRVTIIGVHVVVTKTACTLLYTVDVQDNFCCYTR